MEHDIDAIRETLRLAHERNELRAEWPQALTTFGTTARIANEALEAMALSFTKIAKEHRPGLDVTFTIKEP